MMSRILIRPVRGLEIKLCRMLLGNEGSSHPHYHRFVAVDDDQRPLGVGSVRSGAEKLGESWGVHVTPVPTTNERGVDLALLAYAKAYAVAQHATVLQTLRWFEQGSADEAYWTSLGFAQQHVRYAHEIDVEQGFTRLTPLIRQVREHGWIPDDARIIPLAEADLARVCQLHLQHLGGELRLLLPLLDGSAPHPYDRYASVVLLRGERTLGFTLGWFPDAKVCEIAANVLDPAARLGWADLMLKYGALQQVIKSGAKLFRFCTAEQHTDSRRTLQWVGGGTTRAEVRLQTPCQPIQVADSPERPS